MKIRKKLIIGCCSILLVAAVTITAVLAANSMSITAQASIRFVAEDVSAVVTRAADATTGAIIVKPSESVTVTMNYGTITFANSRETKTMVLRVYNTGSLAFNVTFPTITCANINVTYQTNLNGTNVSTTSLVVNGVVGSELGTATASCKYAQCTYTLKLDDKYNTIEGAASTLNSADGSISKVSA